MQSGGKVEILEWNEGLVFAGYMDVFISIWREVPTVETSKRLAASVKAFGTKAPEGIVMIVVVGDGVELPDRDAREAMARDMKRHDSFTRAMALVYEGDGFGAAAVRSVFAGIQMLARPATPTKVFAAVEEASAWLVRQRSGAPMMSTDLIKAVVEARRAMPQPHTQALPPPPRPGSV